LQHVSVELKIANMLAVDVCVCVLLYCFIHLFRNLFLITFVFTLICSVGVVKLDFWCRYEMLQWFYGKNILLCVCFWTNETSLLVIVNVHRCIYSYCSKTVTHILP